MSVHKEPRVKVADFKLLKKVGEGASGAVYKAEAGERARGLLPFLPLGPVALKLYNGDILKEPNQRMRIAAEYNTGKMLVHLNLVKIYHADVEDERQPFLVMEWCDGDDLKQWREKNPSPEGKTILNITLQLLDVLDFLHSSRRFHRDVKPTNIKIDSEGRVRLLDYGITRALREERITIQGMGRFVGTTLYSAPEYLDEEKAHFDCTSDLYSLGAVIYFLLHGYEIYRNVKYEDLRAAKRYGEVSFDRKGIEKKGALWVVLLKLCTKLLERNPALRFPSGMACWDFLAKEAPKGLVPLRAYFACALTRPDRAQRQRLDDYAEIIKRQAQPNGFSVYFPGEHTHPQGAPDLKAHEVYWIDRERVASADLLMIMADTPSFGVGQEAEIAANAAVPIAIFYSKDKDVKISRMLAGIAGKVLEPVSFGTEHELEEKAAEFFRTHREGLQKARTEVEREYHLDVGERVKEQRGDRLIEEVAAAAHVNPELLISLEERPEQISNISLINLRRIARGLGVSPASLVRETSTEARHFEKLWRESKKSLEEYATRKDLTFKQFKDLKTRGRHVLYEQVHGKAARGLAATAFQDDKWETLDIGSCDVQTASEEVDQMSED